MNKLQFFLTGKKELEENREEYIKFGLDTSVIDTELERIKGEILLILGG